MLQISIVKNFWAHKLAIKIINKQGDQMGISGISFVQLKEHNSDASPFLELLLTH